MDAGAFGNALALVLQQIDEAPRRAQVVLTAVGFREGGTQHLPPTPDPILKAALAAQRTSELGLHIDSVLAILHQLHRYFCADEGGPCPLVPATFLSTWLRCLDVEVAATALLADAHDRLVLDVARLSPLWWGALPQEPQDSATSARRELGRELAHAYQCLFGLA